MTWRLHLTAVAFALLLCGGAGREQPQPFVDTLQDIDSGRWRIADGWSNGDWTANDWRRSQVQPARHGVDIMLARTADGEKRYSSGELQSEDVYRYGYFEARMQAPNGSGLVTGFFTYAQPRGRRSWEEIDIEILGRDTRSLQLTYYRRGENHIVTLPLPFDAASGQHTYGFEWTPRAIRWYVDGQMIHEETGGNGPLPRNAQRLYLHMWNTETLNDWLGPILPAEGPWRLSVSCIAYAPQYQGRPLCDAAGADRTLSASPISHDAIPALH